MLKKSIFSLIVCLFCGTWMVAAQLSVSSSSIRSEKLASLLGKEDTLRKQFDEKGLQWPMKYMYIRSFKHDKVLEVWVKNSWTEEYKLFKEYKICATSGKLGPKRKEGDKQVPEGFYYINEFNPNSNYHLALGLNYPNSSDQVLSDSRKPGGDIYIHGNCVTIGCIPMQDEPIEEIYLLASLAKKQGQDFIPVHIFPVKFDDYNSMKFLLNEMKRYGYPQEHFILMKEAYEYFEKKKQLPLIGIDEKGNYLVSTDIDVDGRLLLPEVKKTVKNDGTVNDVDKVPVFADGTAAYQKFLYRLSMDMVRFLPDDKDQYYVQVEFIVDKEGQTKNVEFLRGTDRTINKKISESLEKNLKWIPAEKDGKAVATRLRQNISIQRPEQM